MIEITLQAVPNQSFSIDIDGVSFDIALKAAGTMIADVTIDQSVKIQGIRCVPGRPLIPYEYLENGNFFFFTENDDYPSYELFGVSQTLSYVTDAELAALRA